MDKTPFKLFLAACIKNLPRFEKYLLTIMSYLTTSWPSWTNLFIKCLGFYHRQLSGEKKGAGCWSCSCEGLIHGSVRLDGNDLKTEYQQTSTTHFKSHHMNVTISSSSLKITSAGTLLRQYKTPAFVCYHSFY